MQLLCGQVGENRLDVTFANGFIWYVALFKQPLTPLDAVSTSEPRHKHTLLRVQTQCPYQFVYSITENSISNKI